MGKPTCPVQARYLCKGEGSVQVVGVGVCEKRREGSHLSATETPRPEAMRTAMGSCRRADATYTLAPAKAVLA